MRAIVVLFLLGGICFAEDLGPREGSIRGAVARGDCERATSEHAALADDLATVDYERALRLAVLVHERCGEPAPRPEAPPPSAPPPEGPAPCDDNRFYGEPTAVFGGTTGKYGDGGGAAAIRVGIGLRIVTESCRAVRVGFTTGVGSDELGSLTVGAEADVELATVRQTTIGLRAGLSHTILESPWIATFGVRARYRYLVVGLDVSHMPPFDHGTRQYEGIQSLTAVVGLTRRPGTIAGVAIAVLGAITTGVLLQRLANAD